MNQSDISFTLDENNTTEIFSKTINPKDIKIPIHDVFEQFLIELQEAIQFPQQLVFVFSAIDEVC